MLSIQLKKAALRPSRMHPGLRPWGNYGSSGAFFVPAHHEESVTTQGRTPVFTYHVYTSSQAGTAAADDHHVVGRI